MNKALILLSIFPVLGLFCLAISWHARRRLAEIQGLPLELVTTQRNRTFPKELLRAAQSIDNQANLPPDEPPLTIGDRCLLLGDIDVGKTGPLVVVDGGETHVVVAWDDGCQEMKMPRAIVRRVRDGEFVRPNMVRA